MPDQLNIHLLLVALFAPLAGALVAGLMGSLFGGHMIRRRTSKAVTVAGVVVSFACSLVTLADVMNGARFEGDVYTWMTVGQTAFGIGFMIDSLSAMMMALVTFISLLVHIYSMGYMENDDNVSRFFSYISLFTFAMLSLVMGNNFIQLFFGWEAVGVMSYLLIGFWLEKPTAVSAGLKAFLVNRVGDFGFMIGIGLVFAFAGSLNYRDVFSVREQLAAMTVPGTGWLVITAICLFLFVGAMGKSAQFPLHVWLPDSMEGPTPISALIHAATMVTAGIFMVARLSPLYELSEVALSVMVIVGAISALFLGLVAMVQTDIKRIVAYSTLSQLGYMVVALGASAYSAAVFHLMTHAFFKALLFLAIGSVILGMHHDQDIRNMGGLRKYMPWTYATALVGSLALVGVPFFSGFYSKESIIGAIRASSVPGATFAMLAVVAGLFVTGFYTFRLFFYVFHGRERFQRQQLVNLKTAEKEKVPQGNLIGLLPGEKPHESPWIIRMPLLLLAIPSVLIGYLAIDTMLYGTFFEGVVVVDRARHPAMSVMAGHFTSALSMTLHEIMQPTFWLAMAGIGTAWYFYMVNPIMPIRLRRRMRFLYRMLVEQYYLDSLYLRGFAGAALRVGNVLWKWIDVTLIDDWIISRFFVSGGRGLAYVVSKVFDVGAMVRALLKGTSSQKSGSDSTGGTGMPDTNATGYEGLAGWFAAAARYFQSGYLYQYVFVMIVGLLCLLLWFVPFSLK